MHEHACMHVYRAYHNEHKNAHIYTYKCECGGNPSEEGAIVSNFKRYVLPSIHASLASQPEAAWQVIQQS